MGVNVVDAWVWGFCVSVRRLHQLKGLRTTAINNTVAQHSGDTMHASEWTRATHQSIITTCSVGQCIDNTVVALIMCSAICWLLWCRRRVCAVLINEVKRYEHVYSPNGSKKQTMHKTDRQINRDRQRIIQFYIQLIYTKTHIQTYKQKIYENTQNTLNQPVTSRAAQILV